MDCGACCTKCSKPTKGRSSMGVDWFRSGGGSASSLVNPRRGALHVGHRLSSDSIMRLWQVAQSKWSQLNALASVRAVIASKQIGHSTVSRLARLLFITDRSNEPTLEVPSCIDDDGRLSYLAIAKRAQVEKVHWYSILALGAGAYCASRKLKSA